MKHLAILGSTGSIGTQTLDIVRAHPAKFKIIALSAGSNWQLLARQIHEFQPKIVAVTDPTAAKKLAAKFTNLLIEVGEEGILQVATAAKADLVISAITGVAGLAPTLAALESGKDVALANKESLVLAGEIIKKAAKKSGAQILPIDSEHSGVWQLIHGRDPAEIRKIILTASGGALRDWSLSKIKKAKIKDVLAHPNWDMGAKVTVDSATLANKAFEVIEAAQLFDLPLSKIEAVIHPQSIVHALVEWVDGSVTAQLAEPDMRLPIQLALTGGDHIPAKTKSDSIISQLDLTKQPLDFQPIDAKKYPLFKVILDAAKKNPASRAAAALAAERAVKKFLAEEISFLGQIDFVKKALKKLQPTGAISLKKISEFQSKLA